eukprot:CAMPEP_0182856390 /NCGR_PEP_ID=MMETSP0034_2-20130328/2407_1 /TAXON_ID=156128 /ORGANISM="Nephroselmis pyriformis, Strain CCMP717" /LENGTH=410 /DNA_ID=CAMNT_0024987459 /DNA_START=67 /DNA_END=1299 /DNA_ORIENTATION=-
MKTRYSSSSSHPVLPRDPHGMHERYTWVVAHEKREGEPSHMPGVREALKAIPPLLAAQFPVVIVAWRKSEEDMGIRPSQFYTMEDLDKLFPALRKVNGPGVLVELAVGEAPRVIAAWGMWKAWPRNGQYCAQEDVLKNAFREGGRPTARGDGRRHKGLLVTFGYHFVPGAGAGGGSPGACGYRMRCGCDYGSDHRDDQRMFRTNMCRENRRVCGDLAVLAERLFRVAEDGFLKGAWASVGAYLEEQDAVGVVPSVGKPSQNFKAGSKRSVCTAAALSRGFESVHHEDGNDAGFTAILWVDECKAGYKKRNEGMFSFLEHNTAFKIESGMVAVFDSGGGVKHGTLAVTNPDPEGIMAARYGLGIYANKLTITSYARGNVQTVPGGGKETYVKESRVTRSLAKRLKRFASTQ